MNRTPVKSSHIASIGYAEGVLHVEFVNGRVYAYTDVSEGVYEMFGAAPSVGKFFHAHILGKYVAEDVTEQLRETANGDTLVDENSADESAVL